MLITKEIDIDMAHRVPNHKSKCKNLHGHRYIIVLGVDDKLQTKEGDSSEGMVIDFSDMKDILMIIDEIFDHGCCLYEKDPLVNILERTSFNNKLIAVDFIPTVENLAKHWYGILKEELSQQGINIKYVKVNETRTSVAIYTKEDEENDRA